MRHIATPRARALAAELHRIRKSRNLSLRDMAHQVDFPHTILSFWEHGNRLPKVEEVAAILGCLRIIGAERKRILDLARKAHEANWLTESIPDVPPPLSFVVECESTASTITEWNPLLVPGLLQTPDYARTIFEGSYVPPDDVGPCTMIRMSRQEVLRRRLPPRYSVILGEEALRRNVGGSEVTAGQVRQLLAVARPEHVSVRVVPAGTGWHPGLIGSFVVYDFPDVPPIILVENYRGSAYLYDEVYVATYRAAARTVQNLALSEQDSRALITQVIGELEAPT